LIATCPDGVWLVELAALADSGLVPQAVAQALELTEQPTRPVVETLCAYLGSKKLLLLLDNAEHLLDGCIHLVKEIVSRGPEITVLVTSRERLGLTGEITYRVPSLTVPGTKEALTPQTASAYESVRLFAERAKLARHDFELTAQNAWSVASVCARLDGMPLAIELAAARVRSMSVDELSERLDQRFALLTGGSRAALPRQRTLRSMLDWSYDLLSEPDRGMLRRMAVFSGGWTLESAEQMCAASGIQGLDVIEQLTSLVDKNLVVTDEHEGSTRYRMLETVRQYGLDWLRDSGEEAQSRGSHLDCFVVLGSEFTREVMGAKQQDWIARIAIEHDNLRAALAWSIEAGLLPGLRLATNLDAFWRIRGYLAEGRAWLTRLLDVGPLDRRTRERARGLYAAGMLASMQGDYAAGKRLLQESLVIFREIDDLKNTACALDGLAYLAIEQAEYQEAEALSRRTVDSARASSDRWMLYPGLAHLAAAVHGQGRWAAARELYEQQLVVARELGTPWQIGFALIGIGRAECDEGRRDHALEHLAEAMTILRDLGDRPGVIESLDGFACVAAAMASPRRAARLWGAADALRQDTGRARSVHESISYERHAKLVRATLTTEAFDQALEEGQTMTLEDAVHYALNLQAENEL